MKIAAVQLRSEPGDLRANLARHVAALETAARLGAEFALFPELSLTGYEPALARRFATEPGDSALGEIQRACDRLRLAAAVGMPCASVGKPCIGMFCYSPGRPPGVYAKRCLHVDELPFFSPSLLDGPGLLVFPEVTCAPAICYESLLPEHAAEAAGMGADTYLASVAKPARGVERARRHYPEIARRHRLRVLMANAVGPSDTFVSAGQSAAWDRDGRLVAELDATSEGMVVWDTRAEQARTVGLP